MIPVVDVSQHQGRINFALMRSRGVRGLIIRATHGLTVDARLAEYVKGARAAGYDDDDLGFYSFCNPKRGPGAAAGTAFVDAVRDVLGHTRTFFMADCESYVDESGSYPPLYGAAYATWLRAFNSAVRDAAPARPIIVYTNAAYWDPNVSDDSFGGHDIIVARYPFYTLTSPQPPFDARLWTEWVMAVTTKRPQVPRGWDGWDGWQFSAGYNRCGPNFGCESRDLDLNIVSESAWARWTNPPLPIPQHPPIEHPPVVVVRPPVPTPSLPLEADDMHIISNSEPLADPDGLVHPAGTLYWKLLPTHEGLYRAAWLAPWEHEASGWSAGTPLPNRLLTSFGQWFPPPSPQPAPVAAVAAVADVAAVAAVAPGAGHGTWASD